MIKQISEEKLEQGITIRKYEILVTFVKVHATPLFSCDNNYLKETERQRNTIYVGIGKTFMEMLLFAEKEHSKKFPDHALFYRSLKPEEIVNIENKYTDL